MRPSLDIGVASRAGCILEGARKQNRVDVCTPFTPSLPLHRRKWTQRSYCSLQTFFRLLPRANTISLRMFSPFEGLLEFLSVMDTDIPHADGIHTARVDVMDEAFFEPKIMSVILIPNVEVLKVVSLDIKQWFVDAPGAGHRLRSLHGL